MASLKEIRKRISTVKNTQQITRAMKMVAAAKLRRAQESMMKGRPYAHNLKRTVHRLSTRVDHESHPLLRTPGHSKALLIVVTSDRGLCGAFNANIIRAAEHFVRDHQADFETIELGFIGRKGYDYFRRRSHTISHYFRDIFTNLEIERVRDDIAGVLIQEFIDAKYDQLFVISNEFRSVVSQNVLTQQLLPIVPQVELFGEEPEEDGGDYIYEPTQVELLDHLLPLYITNTLFSALRESYAAEMGARMSAMENATNNASDMIAQLTLVFNRARQAAITTELIEIVSGAEAL